MYRQKYIIELYMKICMKLEQKFFGIGIFPEALLPNIGYNIAGYKLFLIINVFLIRASPFSGTKCDRAFRVLRLLKKLM